MLNRNVLWLLFWINAIGTIYGFIWYGNQIMQTIETRALWMVLFVPDSPTASLFFTLVLGFLLYNQNRKKKKKGAIVSWIEAMASITLFKYGIWAVAMIVAGAYRGNQLDWKDWMLIASHLGMALEALLYVRYLSFGLGAVAVVAIWTVLNDLLDYTLNIFPWLPKELAEDMHWIPWFTFSLSLISIAVVIFLMRLRNEKTLRPTK